MILAGDVPMNSVVQCDGLSSSIADGALKAAEIAMKGEKTSGTGYFS
jgi:hypothetical protein